MAILTRQAFKGSHYYTRGGVPAHRVPTADGTGDRAATVIDARRLGLLPSVTGAEVVVVVADGGVVVVVLPSGTVVVVLAGTVVDGTEMVETADGAPLVVVTS